MAGDWIKMRTNLDSHPRVIELASILDLHELHVVGMLWKVWSWADSHSIDGNAICVTSVTLDRFTCVTGFADALRKVGWLEGRDGALCFPRFAEHNGQTAKKRAETNERVARHRNAKSVTPVTQKALPEKRREEKREEEEVELRRQLAIPPEYDDPQTVQELLGWAIHLRFAKGNRVPWHSIQKQLEVAAARGQPAAALRARITHSIASGSNGSLFDVEEQKPKRRGKDYSTDTPLGSI